MTKSEKMFDDIGFKIVEDSSEIRKYIHKNESWFVRFDKVGKSYATYTFGSGVNMEDLILAIREQREEFGWNETV